MSLHRARRPIDASESRRSPRRRLERLLRHLLRPPRAGPRARESRYLRPSDPKSRPRRRQLSWRTRSRKIESRSGKRWSAATKGNRPESGRPCWPIRSPTRCVCMWRTWQPPGSRPVSPELRRKRDDMVLELAEQAERRGLSLDPVTRKLVRATQERANVRQRLDAALASGERAELADLAMSGDLTALGDADRASYGSFCGRLNGRCWSGRWKPMTIRSS